ncbi:MAG: 50S ribosomal protein L22 [Epulopiscium sp. Nele67-Bin001]|nr:MAG: 50S ribosomal protein L22 [Epulopiscium sp. Nuni2H_MBin001]OON90613.1 MAG: 50S ribosomal protein L22 [Epulopiscium sp. Nele67-Bin001]
MAKGHRSKIKQQRNYDNREERPFAKAKYVRLSSSKAKIVLDQIKGKDITTALGILRYTPRYAADVIEKVLNSAIANAEHNDGLSTRDLYVEEAYATQGPTLKRIRPRAQGRAFRIDKQTSHITVILNER